jgi:hypothetical protein
MTADSCGTGLGTLILPGDPSGGMTLTATWVFGGVQLLWSFPLINPGAVAFTRIFRGTTAEITEAAVIAEAGGGYHFDRADVAVGTQYYYWVRTVSLNNTVGPVVGPAIATMQPPMQEIIDGMVASISESALAESLRTRIDRIDGISLGLASEIENRLQGASDFSAIAAGLTGSITSVNQLYSSEVAARLAGEGVIVASIDELALAVGNSSASITTEIAIRVSAEEAAGTRMSLIEGSVANASGSILDLDVFLVTGEGSVVGRLAALEAVFVDLDDPTSIGTAEFASEVSARTSADSSQVARLDSFEAFKTSLDGTTSASLTERYDAQVTADAAQASLITNLEAFQTSLAGTTSANINSRMTTLTTADTAQAVSISSLNTFKTTLAGTTSANINSRLLTQSNLTNAVAGRTSVLEVSVAGVPGLITAAINTSELAGADADAAVALSVTELSTSMGEDIEQVTGLISTEASNRTTAIGNVNTTLSTLQSQIGVDDADPELKTGIFATIAQEATTAVSLIEAEAALRETLQLTVNGHTSSIQTDQSVIYGNGIVGDPNEFGVTSQYTVKLDVDGLVSGFGLYNDGASSQFIIKATEFAIGMPAQAGYPEVFPFIIAQVNGVTTIALNAQTLIPDGHIGNAKIGNFIGSDNFILGQSGWGIFKTFGALGPYAEFHNLTARGDIEAKSLKVGTAMVETLNIQGNAVTVTAINIRSGNQLPYLNVARSNYGASEVYNVPVAIAVDWGADPLTWPSKVKVDAFAMMFWVSGSGFSAPSIMVSAAAGAFNFSTANTAGGVGVSAGVDRVLMNTMAMFGAPTARIMTYAVHATTPMTTSGATLTYRYGETAISVVGARR